jgi:hypothetical protein
MKNSTPEHNHLIARLAGYTATAGAMIALANNANSQVVYSGYRNLPVDLLPDFFALDMNDDAIVDFNILAAVSTQSDTFAGTVQYSSKSAYAFILNGRTDTYNSVLLHSNTYYPRAFDENMNINAAQTYWWHAAEFFTYWALLSWGRSYNWTFMTTGGGLYETQYHGSMYFGNFHGTTKYLGVRFQIGPTWHYGWIRLNSTILGSLIVVDWAYEQTANKGIVTGDKPPQVILNAGIVSTYEETVVVSIKFSEEITGLAREDFNIDNGSGRNLTEWIGGREYTIEVTADNPGEVTVELPAGSVTDLNGNPNEGASISYTYEIIDDMDELSNIKFKLYPNPVNGTLNIESETEADISILDMNGRVVVNIENILQKTIDTGDLPQGMYMMKVITSEGVSVHKFVKE